MPEQSEGEPVDRQDTINFRRRRCRTESVEGVTRVGAVRHLRCRREEWSSLHGFALRASPAVTHGVSPPGTVGAGWEVSLFSPSPLLHGFALRASPAVTHSVSPPGTVGADWEASLFSPSPLLHGFALRASPAVTHGVSPLGTVGAGWEVSLFSPSPLLHFSTGSPFGHHPRLRMVCPPLGTVGAGWEVSLFSLSTSPLLHFSTSPRVRPSGITRGYA